MMSAAVISYVPPRGVLNSEAYVTNITHYDPGMPLLLLSNDPNWGFISCPDPEIMKTTGSRFRIANFIFLLALKLALERKLDFFVFMESDSRIKSDGWAKLLLEEFLSYPGCLIGGTVAFYNVAKLHNMTPRIVTEFIADSFKASGSVTSCYGLNPSCIAFVNGSIAVCIPKVCHEVFAMLGFNDSLQNCAAHNSPFDVAIGRYISMRYGMRMIHALAPSALSYSSVDRIYDEQARMNMLRSGEKVAVHPFKSNWTGLD